MKKQKLILLGFLAGSIALTGCSSNQTKEDVAKEEIEIQEIRAEAAADARDIQQDLMEQEMASLPEWVIEPPRADGTGFYGVGTASDRDLVTSMRKAELQAKYALASTIKSELSGEDTMTGSGVNDYRYIINNFVNNVELIGTETVKRIVKPIDGQYKAHILIKLPYDQFNEVLKNSSKKADYKTLQESYERLMNKVNDDSAQKEVLEKQTQTIHSSSGKTEPQTNSVSLESEGVIDEGAQVITEIGKEIGTLEI